MKVSQAAAGRARRVDGGVFFSRKAEQLTKTDSSPPAVPTPYGWKRALEDRIWSSEGPGGVSARAVLVTLVRHADAQGRTWIGIPTIAAKAGLGSSRTVRNALETLARQGWLQILPQTWASLTAEQAAAGRPVPRRGDVGQAPNLYVILDGHGNVANPDGSFTNPPPARLSLARTRPVPFDQGSPRQNSPGGALADQHRDLDPKGSRSRMESVERATREHEDTPHFLKTRQEEERWVAAWDILVAAHASKTKSSFGLAPAPPDLQRAQRQAMAECLLEATAEVATKLRQRSSIEPDFGHLQRELAERVIRLYFKHDSEHLRRVKWALRDLPREIHARMVEAMQQVLREHHEETPARVLPEQPPPPLRTKPLEMRRPEATNNAREAQRILEVLASVPMQEAPRTRRDERVVERTRPGLSEGRSISSVPAILASSSSDPKHGVEAFWGDGSRLANNGSIP